MRKFDVTVIYHGQIAIFQFDAYDRDGAWHKAAGYGQILEIKEA